MPLVKVIKKRLLEANTNADKRLQNTIATPYCKAKRIKDINLLIKNQNEPNWPGQRTDYEIDRDQIIFNPNFARLARKTQVFIGQHDVLYKNRLMHTLEVVQFAKSVAKKENLNIDLVEAIAYGHDIGHTPFGHAGEEALNKCLFEFYIRELLNSHPPNQGVFSEKPIDGELGKEDDAIARRDKSLWTMVECIVGRKLSDGKIGFLDSNAIEALVGSHLFTTLKGLKILKVLKGECLLDNPFNWMWTAAHRRVIEQDFWIQGDSPDFFRHNIHALRVLLADANSNRRDNDITFQTAYGILAHSGKEYPTFTCYIPNLKKPVKLTKEAYWTPEAFLVQKSDDICFANSDIDDAERSKIIEWNNLERPDQKAIWNLAAKESPVFSDFPKASQRLQFCETGFKFIKAEFKYNNTQQIEAAKAIIRKLVYPVLVPRQLSAKHIIRDLFWFYSGYSLGKHIRDVEIAAKDEQRQFYKERNIELSELPPARGAVDYIAHMTDDDAMAAHRALFAPDQAHWVRHFKRDGADS